MLDQRGDRMTVEEVQKIIDDVDENRDGKLNYKEVKNCCIIAWCAAVVSAAAASVRLVY